MRSIFLPTALMVLVACRSPAPPAGNGDTPGTGAATPGWAGFYSNTLPCADCPGILTELELRPDSIFILRERYLERDSIPFGHIGKWSVVGGELELAMGAGAGPEHWRAVPKGLERLGLDGKPINGPLDFTIHRVKSIGTSPIRLTGAYRFDGGSHSFQPCGSAYAFPVALDMADGNGGGAMEKLYTGKVAHLGDPLFIIAVVDIRVGPAMEGDGTQEYLHIGHVEEVLNVDQCP